MATTQKNIDDLLDILMSKRKGGTASKTKAPDTGDNGTEPTFPTNPGGDTGGGNNYGFTNGDVNPHGGNTGDTTGQGTNEGHGNTGNEDNGTNTGTGTGTDNGNTNNGNVDMSNINALLEQLMAGMTQEEKDAIINSQNSAIDSEASKQKQQNLEDLAARGLDFSSVVTDKNNDVNQSVNLAKQQVLSDVETMSQQKKQAGAAMAVQLQGLIEQAREADIAANQQSGNNSSNFLSNLLGSIGTIIAGLIL